MQVTRFIGAMGALLRSPGTTSEHAALSALYRARRASYRQQSDDLYRRYGHVLTIGLSLFGLMLLERPSLLAAPLLQFWRAPAEWLANLAHAAGWMALVAAWAGVHRGFVRGGAFAAFSRSLPLPPHSAALVDLGMLGVSLQIFLLPFCIAIWLAWDAGNPAGADGRFWLYLPLLAVLTVSVAKAVVFGSDRRARLVLAGTFAALMFAGQLPAGFFPSAGVAAVLCFCAREALRPAARVWRHAPAARKDAPSTLPGLPPVLRLYHGLLVRRQPQANLLRLVLAALPQAAAWWMVVYAGKSDDARAFVQLACALSAALVSGFFYTFYEAGLSFQPYLRSIAHGEWRLRLAGCLLVLAATGALFAASLFAFAAALGADHAATVSLAYAAAYWLAWIPLLGLPVIQHHKNGIVLKSALVIAALIIVFKL